MQFTRVEGSGGQLKINSNELSSFADLFDEMAYFKEDNDEYGVTKIEGKSYATIGDVFDIDAAAVEYEGKVRVTIPYNEAPVVEFGSEDDVRFIHYNEGLGVWEDATMTVDVDANTVTGDLNSLSPVTSAIILDSGIPVMDEVQDGNPTIRIMASNPSISVSEAGRGRTIS